MDATIKNTSDVAAFLQVGLVTLFHPEVNRKSSRRYKSVVRGWRDGSYILMDRPKIESGSYLMMRDGQECLVRYTLEGKACGFVGHVLDFEMSRSNASMRVRWPDRVQYTYFRRGERVKCDIPCEVRTSDGAALDSRIVDLSQGGCAIRLNRELPVNTELHLNATLPDGTEVRALPAGVCNSRKDRGDYVSGLKFLDGNVSASNDVAFFVSTRLAIDRGQPAPQNYALIIDNDESITSAITKTLARKGAHCTIGTTVVDSFYRFRAMRPKAIAINFEFEELPAGEVVRLLRADGVNRQTPLVVYGGDGENLEQRAEAAGATKFVPPCKTLGPDVGFLLAKLMNP